MLSPGGKGGNKERNVFALKTNIRKGTQGTGAEAVPGQAERRGGPHEGQTSRL